jgi:hypothetical protein
MSDIANTTYCLKYISSDVLNYRLDKAGFLASFPYLLMAIIVQSAGYLADTARTKGRLSTTQVRKLFTCGSYICQTIFMSLTALFMFRGAAITFISLSLGMEYNSQYFDGIKDLTLRINFCCVHKPITF